MPTATYDLIASNVLSSSASSVAFNSISSSYRDLILVCNWKSVTGTTYAAVRFNSDGSSSYHRVWAMGSSSGVATAPTTGSYLFTEVDAQDTESALASFEIIDYAQTGKHKGVLIRGDRAGLLTNMTAGRWANTAAVTSIEVFAFTGSYAAGSRFYLYGIAG